MVHAEVMCKEENQRRATELGKQGAWMKWDLPVDMSRIVEERGQSFVLKMVYYMLPSPVTCNSED